MREKVYSKGKKTAQRRVDLDHLHGRSAPRPLHHAANDNLKWEKKYIYRVTSATFCLDWLTFMKLPFFHTFFILGGWSILHQYRIYWRRGGRIQCSKTMKWQPCWRTKTILMELNSFLANAFLPFNRFAKILDTRVKTLCRTGKHR